MPNREPIFTLSQLIEKTADELRVLQKTPRTDAVMQFTGCELELAVTLAAGSKGEIKFLLMGSWSANVRGETVSRIKLNFGPLYSDSAAPTDSTDKGITFGAAQDRGRQIVAEENAQNLPSNKVR